MNEIILYQLGMMLFLLDIFWLMYYFFYATAEVYNVIGDKYKYLGHVWIHKRKKDYMIKIPAYMTDKSYTTKYQIITGFFFYKINRNKKIRISFNQTYDVFTCVTDPITVKNYIATYASL